MSIRCAVRPLRARASAGYWLVVFASSRSDESCKTQRPVRGGRERAKTRVRRAVFSMKRKRFEDKQKAEQRREFTLELQEPSHLVRLNQGEVASFYLPGSMNGAHCETSATSRIVRRGSREIICGTNSRL